VSRGRDHGRALFLTIAMAMALELLPLPALVDQFRPYWVGLVLIYWSLETSETIHLGLAFLIGLLLDLMTGSLMGMHALSLVVLVYLVQRFRARLRFFPPWQQALSVLGLLVNDRIILVWIGSLLGEPAPTWRFWLPPLSGLILWPWLFLLLDRLRIGRRISNS
jgi:rod shape-determining protein MreD